MMALKRNAWASHLDKLKMTGKRHLAGHHEQTPHSRASSLAQPLARHSSTSPCRLYCRNQYTCRTRSRLFLKPGNHLKSTYIKCCRFLCEVTNQWAVSKWHNPSVHCCVSVCLAASAVSQYLPFYISMLCVHWLLDTGLPICCWYH